jgi:tetratricopeptide (TPR) repeat protein
MIRAVVVVVALAAATFMVCCSSEEGGVEDKPVTELTEPRDALRQDLMVALNQAKNFHHKADVYLKDARLDLAIESVRKVLDIPFPPDSPEGEDVILDARARLAKLLVTKGQVAEAMDTVNLGIKTAERESFFLANLYTARGEVWEARAVLADEAKKPDDAKRMRLEAIKDFDRSIQINNALLKELVEESRK